MFPLTLLTPQAKLSSKYEDRTHATQVEFGRVRVQRIQRTLSPKTLYVTLSRIAVEATPIGRPSAPGRQGAFFTGTERHDEGKSALLVGHSTQAHMHVHMDVHVHAQHVHVQV